MPARSGATFRDDRFNAADPVLERVTPFENQQYAGTFGGPILRDRMHFFAYDEYEREPKEETWRTPYPHFNVSLQGTSRKKIWGTRLDLQVSPQTRLMLRLNVAKTSTPFGAGNTEHPAGTSRGWENADQLAVQLTNVLSNRTLNELMVSHAGFLFGEENLTQWSNHWMAAGSPFGPITTGSPRITFTNFTIGGNAGAPRYRGTGPVSGEGRLDDLLRCAWPPRREDRRRVVHSSALHEQLHAVHGDHRCERRRRAGQYREPPPGRLQRRHLEPGRDFAAGAALHARHHQEPSRSHPDPGLRGMGAGRLAHLGQADAESRRPLRPAVEHVPEPGGIPAVHGGRTSAERDQHPAAPGLCLSVERTDGAARRNGQVLRRDGPDDVPL